MMMLNISNSILESNLLPLDVTLRAIGGEVVASGHRYFSKVCNPLSLRTSLISLCCIFLQFWALHVHHWTQWDIHSVARLSFDTKSIRQI